MEKIRARFFLTLYAYTVLSYLSSFRNAALKSGKKS